MKHDHAHLLPQRLGAFLLLSVIATFAPAADFPDDPPGAVGWGNAHYVDLAVGQAYPLFGRKIQLVAVDNNVCTVSVDGVEARLRMARQERPAVVNGVRIFVADTRPVADLTTEANFPQSHAATSRDALLCLSAPAQSLLDPARFTFPVSRNDGYRWTMDENSHMFAYLRPTRSHEGIDLNLMEARGQEIHTVVAIEDAVVRWIESGNIPEACLLLQSASRPGIFYLYQHLNRDKVYVQPGQKVTRGQKMAHIWGDGRWGHLHFAVLACREPPPFKDRYQNLLNCFPQLYELWHGTLDVIAAPVSSGEFRFAQEYWRNGNRRRLHAYTDTIGYGWLLGDWCAAGKVEASFPNDGTHPGESARLRKVMHVQTRSPATNPHDWFDFEVAVVNGFYKVKAEIGDAYTSTWQRIEFEGVDAGIHVLANGEMKWTPEKLVEVEDGRLTLRIHLKDGQTNAGVRELDFVKSTP